MEKDQRAHERAAKRVEEIKGFYGHLMVYVFVNMGIFLLDFITGDGWWFYWPLLGWGIGLTAHFLSVFGFEFFVGKDWEKRKIEEYTRKYREEEEMKG